GAAPPATPPRAAGELYGWWLASPLAADSYPASLAVWRRSGEPAAEIRLASVDLSPSLLAALVRSPETTRGARVERLDGSPGVDYVLVAPLAGGDVLTVGVGAPGAGRAGGGGGRWAARGRLAPEPAAHGVVASTAVARLRRAPHQLPGAAGRRARGVLRGPAARARAVEFRAPAGRRSPGR